MWRETGYEILKLSKQKKNYIVVAGHALLMGLVVLGFKLAKFKGPLAKAAAQLDINLRDYVDGLFYARAVFWPTLLMIVPIFVCTLAGDLVAGEMQDGSLRLYIARPRSRSRVLLSKWLALVALISVYSLYFAAASLVVGVLLFGWPGMQVVAGLSRETFGEFAIMSASLTLERYVYCVFYHIASGVALGSITLFFSTLFNRMTSATVAGLTIYFISYVLGGIPFLEDMRPYLITTAMNQSQYFWTMDIPSGLVVHGLLTLAIYMAVFLGLASTLFHAKDIR